MTMPVALMPRNLMSVVNAIAQLPGEDIEEFLLELFDTPPRNLRRSDVAKAMGRRLEPGALLVSANRPEDKEHVRTAIEELLRRARARRA